MNIWLILFLIACFTLLLSIAKIFTLKKSIQEIQHQFEFISKSDTNHLITISSNDRDLKRCCSQLNESLKRIRKLQIEYELGSQNFQQSITNLSHDLRTPLTAIRGYLDLIDRRNLTEKQNIYLNHIDDKTQDLTDLSEQLFYFFKSYERSVSLNMKEVCINTVLEATLCSFYDLFKANHIEPTIQITDTPIIKKLDETMLKRIFENILSNAIKYSENQLSVALNENGILKFSNKTSKLDKTSVEKIFDRYFTVENANKSNGIGLSIAKGLVELNHGQIFSSYEKGIFSITIHFI